MILEMAIETCRRWIIHAWIVIVAVLSPTILYAQALAPDTPVALSVTRPRIRTPHP